MNAISQEDMAYLANQSQDKINMMLSGMTTLMRDADKKVDQMESQDWFQRMVKSVTGKNKATAEEIRKNHNKLDAYMAEAIGELFNRGLVDEKIIIGLGTQINMLYADHVQLKEQLGAFVDKLNKKIESVDNYNMLIQEIDLGDYSKGVSPIVAICEITSLYDDRMLKDERKLEILRKKLENQNIINDEQINIVDCLNEIVNLPTENVGQVAMTLGAMYDKNPFVALMLDLIENYHYLPELTRKMKSKEGIIQDIIIGYRLDTNCSVSAREIYDEFVNLKINTFGTANARSDDNDNTAEEYYAIAEKSCDDKNYVKAYEYYSKAAELGFTLAMSSIGSLYCDGFGVPQDYEQAKKWFQIAIDHGEAEGMYGLGYMYRYGLGVTQDYSKAFRCYSEAAAKGCPSAIAALGFMYEFGEGVSKNLSEAFEYFLEAAQLGNAEAMCEIGNLYREGKAVIQNYAEALKWYERSIGKNSSWAKYWLGCMYCNGEGVLQDYQKAFELYYSAAHEGLGAAMWALGRMYKFALGVEENYEQAKKWFLAACENDWEDAAEDLKDM